MSFKHTAQYLMAMAGLLVTMTAAHVASAAGDAEAGKALAGQ